jgi:hypothetical protein
MTKNPKLDDPWPAEPDRPHDMEKFIHMAFIATLSERFIGIQCSCGTNWCVPRLEVA